MSRRRGHGRKLALDALAQYAEAGDIKLAGLAVTSAAVGTLTTATRFLEAVTAMKAGTFVSWPASKGVGQGRVVSVHTGKVPGIVTQMTASVDAPVARVQLYAKVGKGWSPTAVYLGHPVAALSSIDALPEPAEEAVVVGSFDEIRQNVQAAIRERIEELTGSEQVWAYVYDIGPSWAVYEAGDCSDLFMVEYALDEAGNVQLSDPIEVTKVTTYVADIELPEVGTASEASRLVHARLTGNTVQDLDHRSVTAALRSVAALSAPERIEGRLLGALGTGADGGRIFEVQIIAYGDSKNSRRYPEAVMRAAAPLYEGAPAFDHHRTDVELNTGTVVGLIGHYRNVKATESGLSAELHLLPSSTTIAELLDQTLENQAAGMPVLVGISHDVMTASKPITVNGRPFREVTAVLGVNSADVVVTPAAGGMATRMVATAATATPNIIPTKETTTVTLKQLLALLRAAESAERAALLEQYAHVLEAAGLSADEAVRLSEAAAPASTTEPPAERTEEAKLVKGSAITRIVVDQVVKAASLGTNMAEAILAELPDSFTETELAAKVESTRRVLENAEKAGLAPTVTVTADAQDNLVKALDAMVAGDFRHGFHSLKEAYIAFTGRQPRSMIGEDFNREILRESISLRRDNERIGFDSQLRLSESVDSSTWGYVLGDSITRRLVAMYSQPSLQTWREIVSSIVPVNDFRTQRIQRVGGYGTLPTVAQGAPYQPLTSPGNDTEVTYALAKKGGTEDLTLETIANDDVRVIQQLPMKLGLAAAQTLYRFVWDFLDTNPTIYDSVALFDAGHSNTATNALSGANLSAARKAMRKQAAYGDTVNILSLTPKVLVVCSDLEELAFELATSAVAMPSGAPVGAASNTPNLHQGIKPIVVDYWTSTTKWITVADPAMCPTMEVGFYQGREEPELFVQSDPSNGSLFDADKVTYKIRHIYSGAWLDYRSAYRGNT